MQKSRSTYEKYPNHHIFDAHILSAVQVPPIETEADVTAAFDATLERTRCGSARGAHDNHGDRDQHLDVAAVLDDAVEVRDES